MSERNLKKIEDEVWKIITFADKKYEVSNYGRVKSYCYNKDEGKILKPGLTKGFHTVTFKTNGKKKTFLVHKLVAIFFVPKNNENQSIAIHLDWNKRNNYYKNLKWVTKDEAYKRIMPRLQEINKIKNKGLIRNSKLKAEDVKVLKSMLEKGIKQNVIAKLFSISEMQVTRIKRGENWAHIKASSD
ncbi:MAG: NUMOD4 domain-containing protein [Bacteroidota bacterium]|nr:NUMOD4 domain-containing protein [Bacteroidota bacterium]